MNILIVDDSAVMRTMVRRALRQAGFDAHSVQEASNGREALDLILKSTPDVVLSDWNMPEMSGLALVGELRARGNAVPFGFVTSEGTPEMRAKAAGAGAMFLIAKPFTPEAFRHALNAILGRG